MELLKLQERIEALEGDPIIHIGSKSSFFFVGTKEEYEKNIDVVSADLLEGLKNSLASMKHDDKLFAHNISELSKFNPEIKDETEIRRFVTLAKHTCNGIRSAIRRAKSIPETEKNISEFVPVRERYSSEPQNRLQGDGIIIIVQGCETGKYWSYDEYKNGVVDEDAEELTE